MNTVVIDPTGTYRYSLTRVLAGDGPPMVYVMLNPSTADADTDDPTIRRCTGFANRENASSYTVVNLYALRATDPRELRKHRSPIGPDNDEAILAASDLVISGRGAIVVAWGPKPYARERIAHVKRLLHPLPLSCLGVAKDGSPRHPLMVRLDQPLIPWPVAS